MHLKKIVIAEDDDAIAHMVNMALGDAGYLCLRARDGQEAVNLVRTHTPDLLVLDVMMPRMDGIEVTQRLRKDVLLSKTPIMMLTALSDVDNKVKGFEAGADDYIIKPVDPAELRARVQVGARVVELHAALARRVEELQDALSHIRTLQGLLPICLHCHRIRTDEESWQRLESYIEEHSEAAFSHSLCPECLERYYRNESAPK